MTKLHFLTLSIMVITLLIILLINYSVVPREKGLSYAIEFMLVSTVVLLLAAIFNKFLSSEIGNIFLTLLLCVCILAPVIIHYLFEQFRIMYIVIACCFVGLLIFSKLVCRNGWKIALNSLCVAFLIFILFLSIYLSPLMCVSHNNLATFSLKDKINDSESVELLRASQLAYSVPEQFAKRTNESEPPAEIVPGVSYRNHFGLLQVKVYSPTPSIEAKANEMLPGWKVICMFHQPIVTFDGTAPSGSHANFSAIVLLGKQSRRVILAYTGTKDKATLLWEDFISLSLIGNTSGFNDANGAAQYLMDSIKGGTGIHDLKNVKEIDVTGHSLGGLLAQVGASHIIDIQNNGGWPGLLKRIEIFNSPGFNWNLGQKCDSDMDHSILKKTFSNLSHFYQTKNNKVISHEINGDIVSLIGIHIGERKIYIHNSDATSKIPIVNRHDIKNWKQLSN